MRLLVQSDEHQKEETANEQVNDRELLFIGSTSILDWHELGRVLAHLSLSHVKLHEEVFNLG